MDPEVAALQVEVKTLGAEVDQIRVSVDRLVAMVQGGFAEIRRESAIGARPNWGWIIAGVMAMVAIIGAIGSAWISPLRETDERLSDRVAAAEIRSAKAEEMSTRTDERLRVYREVGVLPAAKP